MDFKILLVTCFLVTSSVVARPSTDPSTCSLSCKGRSSWTGYKQGSTYQYSFDHDVRVSSSINKDQHTRLRLNGLANVEVHNDCEMVLVVKLDQSLMNNAAKVDEMNPQETPKSMKESVENLPLRFSFVDGRIEDICPSDKETRSSLNLKKAILSQFQISVNREKQYQEFYERDILGECWTEYVSESNDVIEKTKDLSKCRKHAEKYPSLGIKFSLDDHSNAYPDMKGKVQCKILLDASKDILQKITCREEKRVRPVVMDKSEDGDDLVVVETALTLTKEINSVATVLAMVGKRTDLVHNHKTSADCQQPRNWLDESGFQEGNECLETSIPSSDVKSSADFKVLVNSKMAELCKDTADGSIQQDTAKKFSELVKLLRGVTEKSDLEEVHQRLEDGFCKDNIVLKTMVHTAIPQLGTKASVSLMLALLESDHLNDAEKKNWLKTGIAQMEHPSVEMFAALHKYLTSDLIDRAGVLAVSSVVYTYCKQNSDCQSNKDISDIVNRLSSALGDDCINLENLEESIKAEALNSIIAVGNMGQFKGGANNLLKCVENTGLSTVFRVFAIQALRRFDLSDYSLKRRLTAVLKDEQLDTELRITAYLAVIRHIAPKDVQLSDDIKSVFSYDQVNEHVRNFIFTHLMNIKRSSDPFKVSLQSIFGSTEFQNAGNFDKKGRQYSNNFEKSYYNDEVGMGAKIESNLIFTEKALLPRSVNFNMSVDVYGESINLLEFGVRLQGMESLLEKMSKLIARKLKLNDTELIRKRRELKYDPSEKHSDYTVESAKSRIDIYSREYGSELFHTELTSELLESIPALMEVFSVEDVKKLVRDQMFSGSSSSRSPQIGSPVQVSLVLPSIAGFPIIIKREMSYVVNMKLEQNLDAKSTKSVSLDLEIRPSGAVHLLNTLAVDSIFQRTGIQYETTQVTNAGVSVKLINDFSYLTEKKFQLKVESLKDEQKLIDAKTEVFLFQHDAKRQHVFTPIKPTTPTQASKQCTSQFVKNLLGHELCYELEYLPSKSMREAFVSFRKNPSKCKIVLKKQADFGAMELSLKQIRKSDKMQFEMVLGDLKSVHRHLRFNAQFEESGTTRKGELEFQNPVFPLKLTNTITSEKSGAYNLISDVKIGSVDYVLKGSLTSTEKSGLVVTSDFFKKNDEASLKLQMKFENNIQGKLLFLPIGKTALTLTRLPSNDVYNFQYEMSTNSQDPVNYLKSKILSGYSIGGVNEAELKFSTEFNKNYDADKKDYSISLLYDMTVTNRNGKNIEHNFHAKLKTNKPESGSKISATISHGLSYQKVKSPLDFQATLNLVQIQQDSLYQTTGSGQFVYYVKEKSIAIQVTRLNISTGLVPDEQHGSVYMYSLSNSLKYDTFSGDYDVQLKHLPLNQVSVRQQCFEIFARSVRTEGSAAPVTCLVNFKHSLEASETINLNNRLKFTFKNVLLLNVNNTVTSSEDGYKHAFVLQDSYDNVVNFNNKVKLQVSSESIKINVDSNLERNTENVMTVKSAGEYLTNAENGLIVNLDGQLFSEKFLVNYNYSESQESKQRHMDLIKYFGQIIMNPRTFSIRTYLTKLISALRNTVVSEKFDYKYDGYSYTSEKTINMLERNGNVITVSSNTASILSTSLTSFKLFRTVLNSEIILRSETILDNTQYDSLTKVIWEKLAQTKSLKIEHETTQKTTSSMEKSVIFKNNVNLILPDSSLEFSAAINTQVPKLNINADSKLAWKLTSKDHLIEVVLDTKDWNVNLKHEVGWVFNPHGGIAVNAVLTLKNNLEVIPFSDAVNTIQFKFKDAMALFLLDVIQTVDSKKVANIFAKFISDGKINTLSAGVKSDTCLLLREISYNLVLTPISATTNEFEEKINFFAFGEEMQAEMSGRVVQSDVNNGFNISFDGTAKVTGLNVLSPFADYLKEVRLTKTVVWSMSSESKVFTFEHTVICPKSIYGDKPVLQLLAYYEKQNAFPISNPFTLRASVMTPYTILRKYGVEVIDTLSDGTRAISVSVDANDESARIRIAHTSTDVSESEAFYKFILTVSSNIAIISNKPINSEIGYELKYRGPMEFVLDTNAALPTGVKPVKLFVEASPKKVSVVLYSEEASTESNKYLSIVNNLDVSDSGYFSGDLTAELNVNYPLSLSFSATGKYEIGQDNMVTFKLVNKKQDRTWINFEIYKYSTKKVDIGNFKQCSQGVIVDLPSIKQGYKLVVAKSWSSDRKNAFKGNIFVADKSLAYLTVNFKDGVMVGGKGSLADGSSIKISAPKERKVEIEYASGSVKSTYTAEYLYSFKKVFNVQGLLRIKTDDVDNSIEFKSEIEGSKGSVSFTAGQPSSMVNMNLNFNIGTSNSEITFERTIPSDKDCSFTFYPNSPFRVPCVDPIKIVFKSEAYNTIGSLNINGGGEFLPTAEVKLNYNLQNKKIDLVAKINSVEKLTLSANYNKLTLSLNALDQIIVKITNSSVSVAIKPFGDISITNSIPNDSFSREFKLAVFSQFLFKSTSPCSITISRKKSQSGIRVYRLKVLHHTGKQFIVSNSVKEFQISPVFKLENTFEVSTPFEMFKSAKMSVNTTYLNKPSDSADKYQINFENEIVHNGNKLVALKSSFRGRNMIVPSKLNIDVTGIVEANVSFSYDMSANQLKIQGMRNKLGLDRSKYSFDVLISTRDHNTGFIIKDLSIRIKNPSREFVLSEVCEFDRGNVIKTTFEFYLNKRLNQGITIVHANNSFSSRTNNGGNRRLEIHLPTRKIVALSNFWQNFSVDSNSVESLDWKLFWDGENKPEKSLQLKTSWKLQRDRELDVMFKAPFVKKPLSVKLGFKPTNNGFNGQAIFSHEVDSVTIKIGRECSRLTGESYGPLTCKTDVSFRQKKNDIKADLSVKYEQVLVDIGKGYKVKISILIPSQEVSNKIDIFVVPGKRFLYSCNHGSSLSVTVSKDKVHVFISDYEQSAGQLTLTLNKRKTYVSAVLDSGKGTFPFPKDDDLTTAVASYTRSTILIRVIASLTENGQKADLSVVVGKQTKTLDLWKLDTVPNDLSVFFVGFSLEKDNRVRYMSKWKMTSTDQAKSGVYYLKTILFDKWAKSAFIYSAEALGKLHAGARASFVSNLDPMQLVSEMREIVSNDGDTLMRFLNSAKDNNEFYSAVIYQSLLTVNNMRKTIVNYLIPYIQYFADYVSTPIVSVTDVVQVLNSIANNIVDVFSNIPFDQTLSNVVSWSRKTAQYASSYFSAAVELVNYFLSQIFSSDGSDSIFEIIFTMLKRVTPIDFVTSELSKMVQQLKESLTTAWSSFMLFGRDSLIKISLNHLEDAKKAVAYYKEMRKTFSQWYNSSSPSERFLLKMIIPERQLAFLDNVAASANLFLSGNYAESIHKYFRTDYYKVIQWKPVCASCLAIVEGRFYSPFYLPSLRWRHLMKYPIIASIRQRLRKLRASNSDGYVYLSNYSDWKESKSTSVKERLTDMFFPKHRSASVFGSQHLVTFDGKVLSHSRPCDYLLTHDFENKDFYVIQKYVEEDGKIQRADIVVKFDSKTVIISKDGQIQVNGKLFKMPFTDSFSSSEGSYSNAIVAEKRDQTVKVSFSARVAKSLVIRCQLNADSCEVKIHPLYHGRMNGALGSNDGSVLNDVKDLSFQTFHFKLWSIGKCSTNEHGLTLVTRKTYPACNKWFRQGENSFSKCFGVINPRPYFQICNEYLNAGKPVCDVTLQYVERCRSKKVRIHLPESCVKCPINNRKLDSTPQYISEAADLKSKVQVVVLIENSDCHYNLTNTKQWMSYLSNIIRRMTETQKNLKTVEFGLALFGRSKTLKMVTISKTSDYFGDYNEFENAIKNIELDKTKVERSDVFNAISQVSDKYEWDALAQKHLIVFSCSKCPSSNSFNDAEVLNAVKAANIEIHAFTDDYIGGANGPSHWANNVVGYSSTSLYYLDGKKEPYHSTMDVNPTGHCVASLVKNLRSGSVWSWSSFAETKTNNALTLVRMLYENQILAQYSKQQCKSCHCVLGGGSVGKLSCSNVPCRD